MNFFSGYEWKEVICVMGGGGGLCGSPLKKTFFDWYFIQFFFSLPIENNWVTGGWYEETDWPPFGASSPPEPSINVQQFSCLIDFILPTSWPICFFYLQLRSFRFYPRPQGYIFHDFFIRIKLYHIS